MFEGITMLTVLAGLGIYFVKSTDIPKDMKEKSAQMRATYGNTSLTAAPKKYAFDKKTVVNSESLPPAFSLEELKNKTEASKRAEIEKYVKRQSLVALQNQKIDELTLLITSLEQEIKENNSKNADIQIQIDTHLEALRNLQESVIA